jgi:hypothetical protein
VKKKKSKKTKNKKQKTKNKKNKKTKKQKTSFLRPLHPAAGYAVSPTLPTTYLTRLAMIPRLALPLPLHLRRNSVLGISSIRAAGSRAAEHVVVLVWVRGS